MRYDFNARISEFSSSWNNNESRSIEKNYLRSKPTSTPLHVRAQADKQARERSKAEARKDRHDSKNGKKNNNNYLTSKPTSTPPQPQAQHQAQRQAQPQPQRKTLPLRPASSQQGSNTNTDRRRLAMRGRNPISAIETTEPIGTYALS